MLFLSIDCRLLKKAERVERKGTGFSHEVKKRKVLRLKR
jgi:hypothetical protein